LRFGLDLYLELLDLHTHSLDYRLKIRRLPVQSRARNAREFSQTLHDGYLRGLHRKKRTQKDTQSQEANDRQQNQKKSFHVYSPF
jgi:hypothetical protein